MWYLPYQLVSRIFSINSMDRDSSRDIQVIALNKFDEQNLKDSIQKD